MAIQLSTAGGPCEAAEELVLETDMLEEKSFKPAVLDATPAALSAGWRCMELGYEFHWKPYQPPILIYPSGKRITLRVDSYVPILDAEVYTAAQYAESTQMFALPARMVSEVEPVALVAIDGGVADHPLEDGVREEDDDLDVLPLGIGGGLPAMDPPAGREVADGVGGGLPAVEPDDYDEPDLEGDPVSLRDQAMSLTHLLTHVPKRTHIARRASGLVSAGCLRESSLADGGPLRPRSSATSSRVTTSYRTTPTAKTSTTSAPRSSSTTSERSLLLVIR